MLKAEFSNYFNGFNIFGLWPVLSKYKILPVCVGLIFFKLDFKTNIQNRIYGRGSIPTFSLRNVYFLRFKSLRI